MIKVHLICIIMTSGWPVPFSKPWLRFLAQSCHFIGTVEIWKIFELFFCQTIKTSPHQWPWVGRYSITDDITFQRTTVPAPPHPKKEPNKHHVQKRRMNKGTKRVTGSFGKPIHWKPSLIYRSRIWFQVTNHHPLPASRFFIFVHELSKISWF